MKTDLETLQKATLFRKMRALTRTMRKGTAWRLNCGAIRHGDQCPLTFVTGKKGSNLIQAAEAAIDLGLSGWTSSIISAADTKNGRVKHRQLRRILLRAAGLKEPKWPPFTTAPVATRTCPSRSTRPKQSASPAGRSWPWTTMRTGWMGNGLIWLNSSWLGFRWTRKWMTFHALHFNRTRREIIFLFGFATGRVPYTPKARWLYSFRVFFGPFKAEILWRTGTANKNEQPAHSTQTWTAWMQNIKPAAKPSCRSSEITTATPGETRMTCRGLPGKPGNLGRNGKSDRFKRVLLRSKTAWKLSRGIWAWRCNCDRMKGPNDSATTRKGVLRELSRRSVHGYGFRFAGQPFCVS